MSKTTVAAQLYTLRDYMKTPEDIANSLKKVAKAGYKAVQLSGLGPIEPKELKKIADSEGLEICATHIPFERIRDEAGAVMEEHNIWNCKYIGIGGMPQEYHGSKEGFIRFAKEASQAAKILVDNGFRFVYHNHDFEFEKFDGQTGMDILFSESDKETFDFEIDTYWVQAGGGDPAAWIEKMKGRMDIVHFKDMVMGPERKRLMAEVGEGNLNWPAIIKACRNIGIKWYIVEQDICQRDPFESLEISLNNLKKMGIE